MSYWYNVLQCHYKTCTWEKHSRVRSCLTSKWSQETRCHRPCWSSTLSATSLHPCRSWILTGKWFPPDEIEPLTFSLQRGWQGWAEVLHGSKLLLRLVATRNAKGHGKDDAWQGKEGILSPVRSSTCSFVNFDSAASSQRHRGRSPAQEASETATQHTRTTETSCNGSRRVFDARGQPLSLLKGEICQIYVRPFCLTQQVFRAHYTKKTWLTSGHPDPVVLNSEPTTGKILMAECHLITCKPKIIINTGKKLDGSRKGCLLI